MKLFTKRETLIVALSVVLIVAAGMYIIILHKTQTTHTRLIENQNMLLKEKEAGANETANRIEAICAEYRKLYMSYRELRYPNPTSVDRYIGLPGSARGQIDKCYLPD